VKVYRVDTIDQALVVLAGLGGNGRSLVQPAKP
jgi:hypothetical protein